MRFLAAFALIVVVVLGSSFLLEDGSDTPLITNPTTSTDLSADATASADGDDAADSTEDSEQAEPTAEPTPAATATPEPDEETVVTMAFSGEVLSHGSVIRQAEADGNPDQRYDYAPMFSEVSPLLESVDVAVCHLETPVSPDNSALSGYPIFNAPTELPKGLVDAGYDGCSTASNHSYDKGAFGVRATLDVMETAGLPQAGMARTADEAAAPRLYEVGDVTVGHLSYTYGLNGFVLPADELYLVNVIDTDAILAEAAAAKAAGADLVVLSIQWGNEYQVEPSAVQVEQATTFLNSPDIDLIMGAHVHVVQPADIINGKYVMYGLGNFLSNQSSECCPAASQNGIIAFVEITGTEADGYAITDVSFTVTRVDRSNYRIVPVKVALDDVSLDAGVRSLYEDVLASTTEVVNRRGAGLELYEPRPEAGSGG